MNEYIVIRNQQVAVKANDPDEAMKKVLNGEGTTAGGSMNVSMRPPKPAQPERPTSNG